MRKRLAAISISLAGLALLTVTATAHAGRHSGPPAVGAGTGRLTMPVVSKAKNRAETPRTAVMKQSAREKSAPASSN